MPSSLKLELTGHSSVSTLTKARTPHEEELRNSILAEVKQSVVLNEEGSEKLKMRELSDAIYQELGSKIMGQISDEVWNIIKSSETEIRQTVELVYNRLVNPEENIEKKEAHASPRKKHRISDQENHDSPAKPSNCEPNVLDENELNEPPGFVPSVQHSGTNRKSESPRLLHEEKPRLHEEEMVDPPPGFSPCSDQSALPRGVIDEDPDVPPGFG
ncbi:uncharacterized protein LOC109721795 isoform X2 [Ananas comosus]|uniref:Uncharacterized protein LOC109721795 isoform X2 n=1 Tax=Ananas comosus TaxID=4615 RepID=A0A6P5G982_ANACO|nr:uncharacterized protein LOC109721795 isoform X2 [Ananas comosus]XP_020105177.1 uncharacterized protein LOC109721795 isoform X2 [Ananas comosus]